MMVSTRFVCPSVGWLVGSFVSRPYVWLTGLSLSFGLLGWLMAWVYDSLYWAFFSPSLLYRCVFHSMIRLAETHTYIDKVGVCVYWVYFLNLKCYPQSYRWRLTSLTNYEWTRTRIWTYTHMHNHFAHTPSNSYKNFPLVRAIFKNEFRKKVTFFVGH